jgi:hypothetical protein
MKLAKRLIGWANRDKMEGQSVHPTLFLHFCATISLEPVRGIKK